MLILFKRNINFKKTQRNSIGVSMIETLIVIPVVIFTCLLALQISLLYRAKIALNYATLEAARVGSTSNARIVPRFLTDWSMFLAKGKSEAGTNDKKAKSASIPESLVKSSDGPKPDNKGTDSGAGRSESKAPKPPESPNKTDKPTTTYFKSFGKGLLRYGDSSVLQGFINGITPFYTKGPNFIDIAKGQISAYGDAMMNSCILYHSPTQSAFLDFGFVEIEGPDKWILQIPNDFMRYRVPGSVDRSGKGVGYYKKKGKFLSDETEGIKGYASSMSIQEATLLSIEIQYSAKMVVPIAREILIGIAMLYGIFDESDTKLTKAFAEDAFSKGRWPLSSYATYRMQSPVHWNLLMPFDLAFKDPVNLYKLAVHENINQLWDLVPGNFVETEASSKPQIGFCPGLLVDVVDGGSLPGQSQPIGSNWLGEDYDRKFKERNP